MVTAIRQIDGNPDVWMWKEKPPPERWEKRLGVQGDLNAIELFWVADRQRSFILPPIGGRSNKDSVQLPANWSWI